MAKHTRATSAELSILKELQSMVEENRPATRRVDAEVTLDMDEPATTCFELMREEYAVMKAAFIHITTTLQTIEKHHEAQCTNQDYVDLLYAMRSTRDYADRLKKDIDELMRRMYHVVCTRHSLDPNAPSTYIGQFATAVAQQKVASQVPSPELDKEAYHKIMEWFGIPWDCRDHGKILTSDGGEMRTKIFDIDYLGFNDFLNRWVLAGNVLPDFLEPFLQKSYQPYVKVTRSRDLL